MVWPFRASAPNKHADEDNQPKKRPVSWPDSLGSQGPGPLAAAKAWAPMVGFSLVGLAALQLYANYLRRIPGAAYVRPNFFRNRSLFGKVTSVGDGDNFHLFHTPGGKAVGWGWLRKVPETRKELKGRTVRTCSFLPCFCQGYTTANPCLYVSANLGRMYRYPFALPRLMRQRERILESQLSPTQTKPCSGFETTSCTEMCAHTSTRRTSTSGLWPPSMSAGFYSARMLV